MTLTYTYAKGCTLTLDSNVIGQVISISDIGNDVGTIDITDLVKTRKTYLAGLPDGKEVAVEFFVDPTDANQMQHCLTLSNSPAASSAVFTTADGTYTFDCILTSFGLDTVENENVIHGSASLKINSDVTYAGT